MTKAKVFWLSFFASLSILVPLYLGAYAYGHVTGGASTVEKKQSGIWVAQATAEDARTVLVMTGNATAQTAETYALVRFDPARESVTVAAMPPETVVLVSGAPTTLAQAAESAGPSQCVAALRETLGIPVDNYLFASPQTLWQMMESFGTVQLRLGNYVTPAALAKLGLDIPGGETQTLTPRLLAQVLAQGDMTRTRRDSLRAIGYAAYLTAGQGRLGDTLPAAVRAASTKVATNITAAQLYDYERTLRFTDRQLPTYHADLLSGAWNGQRYELDEASVTFAQSYLGAKGGDAPAQTQPAAAEDEQPS